ncbi:chaoptin-like [Anopheles marshallii]|uniref:chaoptin-like n=1 Tax=Anopheles marshallii TaxID=1521116 RepID=UPI00237AB8D2|nr:chaoptin-like [Anopheles marshallii]
MKTFVNLCDADYACTIRNWNPSEKGTFVLDHIPNTHGSLEMYNLLVTSSVVVFLCSTLFRKSVGLNLKCDADYICEIRNWNPSEEKTFVLRHIPNTHGSLELYNLLVTSTTSKLFDIFERSRKGITISLNVLMSPIHNFVLENGATFDTLAFENTYLSSILFGKNCSLAHLRIIYSKLSHLPNSIQELNELKTLTISHSLILAVNLNVIGNLPKLTMLDLTRNRIHSLYCTAENASFPTLAYVHLRENMLRSINMNIFNGMKYLENIDLTHNLISVVSGTLVSSSLKLLDLSYNKLLKMDCCKWNVPNVHKLIANDNLFLSLPRCIEQAFVNVFHLNFDNNQLDPDELFAFGRFKNLMSLSLKNNKLTNFVLNETTIPMKMTVLNLSINKLRRLQIPYLPNKDIYIDISWNCISNVDWDKISTNLTKLEMTGNPLDCTFGNTFSFNSRANHSCIENNNHICD